MYYLPQGPGMGAMVIYGDHSTPFELASYEGMFKGMQAYELCFDTSR